MIFIPMSLGIIAEKFLKRGAKMNDLLYKLWVRDIVEQEYQDDIELDMFVYYAMRC
jgi:hypothetical protein